MNNWFFWSELDSRRFGVRIFRTPLGVQIPEPTHARQQLAEAGAQLLILRVSSGDTATPRHLTQEGDESIYADSLVYYSVDLAKFRTLRDASEPGDFLFRSAVAGDVGPVRSIADEAFNNYRSHYAANPRLEGAERIAAGYAEWAVEHVRSEDPDKMAWVAEDSSGVIAFATVQNDSRNGTVEVLLNAVRPARQGEGIYPKLLHFVLNETAAAGASTLRISTQLANIRVQRVWARLGLEIETAYDTYHLNLRHNDSEEGPRS